MLALGLASSHAPSMFRSAEHWPTIHRVLTEGVPQPPQIRDETPDVLEAYVKRIENGFAALRAQLEAVRPDALLVVGDDQGEVFSPDNVPSYCLFTGSEVRGTLNVSLIGEAEEENHVTIRCHRELALHLFGWLKERGFDLASLDVVKPLGRPKRGIGHAFTRPVVKVIPKLDIPTINLHLNAYFPPLPDARHCYELGRAIAEAFEGRPERVAIMASGGLSHDPRGPRAGWIDTALDHWVLDQLKSGQSEALCHLFEFDSDTLRGGTGEIRSWIVVAGACAGAKATVIDYIPAHHAVTGLGFAYWSPQEMDRTRARGKQSVS